MITRINNDVNALGDLYNRNAELPLKFRVPGAVYASVADIGDALYKKYVVLFNQYPDPAYYWDQPAEQEMRNGVDSFERSIFEFSDRVIAQEKAYQAAQKAAPEEFVGPPMPEEISVAPGQPGTTPKPSNLPLYIGLGVVALAAIVGAALLSPAPESTSGPVETIPREEG